MANKQNTSPNKFINALFGGPARRREQRMANENHEDWLDTWSEKKNEKSICWC